MLNWFEEQLQVRSEHDEQIFSDALQGLSEAVMGKRLAAALDNIEIANTALERVLKYYHLKLKGKEVPPQLKTIDERLSYQLRPLGIMRRKVNLSSGWYIDAYGPMLGTLKADGSIVALIPGKFSGYYYEDILSGKRIRVNKKTEKLVDEEAWCFYLPLPLKSLNMLDLIRFMSKQVAKADYLVMAGAMGIVTLIGLLSPQFVKWLFGDVLRSGSLKVLLSLAVFMACYGISNTVFGIIRALAGNIISIKQNNAVQAAVMNRILSLPSSFFKDFASGDLNQRSMYVQALCSMLSSTILITVMTSIFSLTYIGSIFAYTPELAIPALIVQVFTVVVTVFATKLQVNITREQMKREALDSGLTYSMLTGLQKIKLAGAEKRMFARWAKGYTQTVQLKYNVPKFITLAPTITMAISMIGTIFIYVEAVEVNISVSNYYAFNTAFAMVSAAFASLAGIVTQIANISPTLEMAKPIMEAEPEFTENKEIVTNLSGSIELSHVCFKYDQDSPNIIDDLSLKIKSGEYVAIVGSTGCGKSTLLRLLLGFEKPQKGAIYYDRKDMNNLDLKSLRRKIGTVLQDGKLFAGDIYSNIIISAPQLTMDEAWEAAEIASIADDIRAMPMGMYTMIMDGQGGFSGGQRQRLMIARAVASKPRILLFDEATSALDNITQKKVSDAIDSLKCTRIVIAHRLSTIRHCDRIIFLDKGKIVEDGTYDELISLNGHFADLVARQRLDVE